MTQQEFIEDFESKNNWLLRFENDFAIFTQNTWSSKVDFQLNRIFWFMGICNSKGIDIFNNTWMEIDELARNFAHVSACMQHRRQKQNVVRMHTTSSSS